MAGIISVIVISTVLSYIATENGLAFDRDGCYYLSAARIFSAFWGRGRQAALDKELLLEITKHYADTARRWPPFYPVLLSAVSISTDPYVAARWLHLLFPLIIGLLLWFLFSSHQRTYWQAFPVIAIILFSPEILLLNWYAYSEMLFITGQLLVLLAVSRYLHTGRLLPLTMAVIFIALACLTRYVGVVMAFALAITVWRVNHEKSIYQKAGIAGLCLVFSLLPVMLYLVIPMVSRGAFEIAGRSFSWGWDAGRLLIFSGSSLISFFKYLSPSWGSSIFQIIFTAFAVISVFLIVVFQRQRRLQGPPAKTAVQLQYFIAWCVLSYLLLVVVWSLLLDPVLGYSGITQRIVAPLFVWTVLLIAFLGGSGWQQEKLAPTMQKFIISLFLFFFITFSCIGAGINAIENRDLVDSKHRAWENAPALAYIKNLPYPAWIVSNKPYQVFQYSGIPTFQLPSHFDIVKFRPNENYSEQMDELRRMLRQRNGMVIYFNPYFQYRSKEEVSQETTLNECMALLDLKLVFYTKNAFILQPD